MTRRTRFYDLSEKNSDFFFSSNTFFFIFTLITECHAIESRYRERHVLRQVGLLTARSLEQCLTSEQLSSVLFTVHTTVDYSSCSNKQGQLSHVGITNGT